MILYKDKTFVTNSGHPNDDWTGSADYVLDDSSELAQKVMQLFPKFVIVTDENGTVTDIIRDESYSDDEIAQIISDKKSEVSAECEKAIISGVDVGEYHYSLTVEDQANILAWMAVAQSGKSVPYHADGISCRIYSADEFLTVANAAVTYKTHHTTYCNLLMRQIESMTDAEQIAAVRYGVTELQGEYAEQYRVIIESLT